MNLDAIVNQPTVPQINAALQRNLTPVVRWSTPVDGYCKTAGGIVVVAHDLNVIPNDLDVLPWIDARVWADIDDRRAWSATVIVFHASAAGRYTVKAGQR